MSDSDWEVLSTDGDTQSAPQAPSSSVGTKHPPTGVPAHADPISNTSPPTRAFPAMDRRTVLEPLCLTLNQTGTRLGVGHTKGYFVFRVTSSNSDATHADPSPSSSLPSEAPDTSLPTQSRLTLDPQYNIDLLTFSHVRERMRRQQERRRAEQQQQQQQSEGSNNVSLPAKSTTSTLSTHADKGESNALPLTPSAEAERVVESSSETKAQRSPEGADTQTHCSPLDHDDLGSFLTAAGRAFAQIKRSDAQGSNASPATLTSCQRASRTTESAHARISEVQSKPTAEVTGDGVTATEVSRHHDLSTAPVLLTPPSAATTLEPSPVLEWGEDEDIDVDASDSSVNDVPLSSIGDSAWARRRERQSHRGVSALTGEDDYNDKRLGVEQSDVRESGSGAEDDEDEDSFIGFEGGGVAVMAFLYDQTWLALVGGGPTPMSRPNEIQFVRDGERQHQLTTPHPVVRLFLDARLLFVVTTAELRVYTNPLEHNWVCLRQRVSMSASLAARYTDVPLAPFSALKTEESTEAVKAASIPFSVWGAQGQSFALENDSLASPTHSAPAGPFENNPSHARASRIASTKATPNAPSTSAGKSYALPSLPVVVDYARNLLLLPVGEAGTGFALYRYVTGPEPAARPLQDALRASPSATGTTTISISNIGEPDASASSSVSTTTPTSTNTGRTTAFLQHVATQVVAHKNPLHNLVLYVGWPAASTRLLSTDEKEASSTNPSMMKGPGNDSMSTSASRILAESTRGGGHAGGPVTLVAAASEYATRITLWMLRHPDCDGSLEFVDNNNNNNKPTRTALRSGGATSSAADASFVLLREFRVGLRLAPPKMVMAALPGVSRFMARGQPTHNSTTAASAAAAAAAVVAGAHTNGVKESSGAEGRDAGPIPRSRAASAIPGATLEKDNGSGRTSAAGSALYGLPHDAASTSRYRGSVTAWATEAAAVVAACAASTSAAATSTPAVHHLQFAHNGAFLLCVHGPDAVSVFSTSAPESAQEAKDVTRDRAVAEQNRYSRLSVMKEYLPKALSSRLDAYTRQAWSSCSGRLPSFDPAFVPRWLYLRQQDVVAAATARTQPTTEARDAAATRQAPASKERNVAEVAVENAASTSDGSSAPQRGSGNEGSAGGRRFFQRLSMLVGARPQLAQPQQPSLPPSAPTAGTAQPNSPVSVSSAAESQRVSHAGSPLLSNHPATTTSMTTPTTATTSPPPQASHAVARACGTNDPVYWGVAFTELSQCIRLWPASAHHVYGLNNSSCPSAYFGPGRHPVVLNCATCEGAFTNIYLFAEEGEIAASRVVPYAAE